MDSGDSGQCSSGQHDTGTSNNKFMPIGPASLNQQGGGKKPYKFVEPPGITDWIISFTKKCLVCGLVYSFGYFQWSVGWLVGPIVLLVVRDQWRRHHDSQRALAAAAARGDEREIILARLGDNLPSWVIFPDVERAEWLNQIIKQLWPRINNYTFDLVRDIIEPVLTETLATTYKMPSFRFEKIILGDTPVRVRGVKVYDEKKTDRGEIIMDLDIIYAGDCDFRFSLAKIKSGIKDLHLSGILRLVMKPLINQIPFVGGVQYFFLNPPTLDFNLVGAADVFDMPGLSDLIRRIVQEQICAMCVLPNKMFIQLSDQVNARETCATRPQGIIRICAIEAKNLMKKDVNVLGTGKSDPYVILSVGAQQHKSKVINNTVNPKWEYYCECMVEELGQKLNVELYDHDDAPRADEFLGRTSVDLSLVSREGTLDLWLELEDVKKGQIHLKLSWLGFSDNPAELKNAIMESQSYALYCVYGAPYKHESDDKLFVRDENVEWQVGFTSYMSVYHRIFHTYNDSISKIGCSSANDKFAQDEFFVLDELLELFWCQNLEVAKSVKFFIRYYLQNANCNLLKKKYLKRFLEEAQFFMFKTVLSYKMKLNANGQQLYDQLLKMGREGSKPDPYAILSVGKIQHESDVKEKTSDPVYEETFHFLVRNPLTDTLLVKLVDRKSSVELGAIKQSLDLVYHRPDMKMEKQNLTLNTTSEAKIALTMEIKVLKLGPAKLNDADESTDHLDPDQSTSSGNSKTNNPSDSDVPVTKPTESGSGSDPVVTASGEVRGDQGSLDLEPIIIRSNETDPLLFASKEPDGDGMKVRLTIRYSQTVHQLIVVVHTVTNLPIEKEELPDPYVKLHILPEKSKTKRKTEAKKDQCNPTYDERFEFPVIDLRGKTLHVQICDKKFIRSSPRLGEVYVALDDFALGNVVTSWYPLST